MGNLEQIQTGLLSTTEGLEPRKQSIKIGRAAPYDGIPAEIPSLKIDPKSISELRRGINTILALWDKDPQKAQEKLRKEFEMLKEAGIFGNNAKAFEQQFEQEIINTPKILKNLSGVLQQLSTGALQANNAQPKDSSRKQLSDLAKVPAQELQLAA